MRQVNSVVKIERKDVKIPADVPAEMHDNYCNNFLEATGHTGNLMMFAADQKIEHLNDDFYATETDCVISQDDSHPEHLFRIANSANIGVFGSQLGLIAQYGRDYPDIRYVAKLNSKTHLVGTDQRDPLSKALWKVRDVVEMEVNSGLHFCGIGYTVYLGSEYENEMLIEAAQVIKQAHNYGMLAIIWMYPRGQAIQEEKDTHLIAGAAGVAACLGADFVKVNYPDGSVNTSDEAVAQAFKEPVAAAGRTGVICAGGSSTNARELLQKIYDQIYISGVRGNATGRNIHQKNHEEAVRMCNAISAITLHGRDVEYAEKIYLGTTN